MAHRGKIPGLYSSDKNLDWSSDNLEQEAQNNTNNSMNMDTSQNQDSSSVLNEIRTEKDNLGLNFVHAHRLLDAEITKLQHGSKDFTTFDSNTKQVEKIFVNLQDQKQHNLVGRLLGPKGVTLKRIQAETQTKISILGRGSMRDKKKEEELANGSEPGFEHLKEPLHVLVEASPPYSNVKLAAAVTEVRKMLIPLEPGAQDLIAAKFIDPIIGGNLPGGFREGLLPSPVEDGFSGGRGGGARGGRGGPRGGGGGARGAPSRGGPPMRGRGRGGGEPMRGRGGGPRGAGGARGGGGPRGGGGSRGGAPRGAGRGGAGERGGRGRPRGRGAGSGGGYEEGGYGSRGESGGYGGNRGDGSGGGPIRARASAASFDRMADYKPETNVGYGSDYDRGYSERDDAGYRRSDHASSAAEGDSYYSNYSESPARGYSRDYNHGSGEGEAEGSDWKPRSRGEYRHHPYQQSSGYY